MTDQTAAQRAFSLFSPFIKDYIYQSGWNELRRVQALAASEIFFTEKNVLISSETASGKTEAALFPILSIMEKEGVSALYISPLKALINDQYSRMDFILRESGIPVHRWHGDVGKSHKDSFLKSPRGLLQITPESLESMLIRRANDIPRLFANLRFVIIDEVHALMGSDRGNQILCQLERIGRLISYHPRRIGLSATLGDPEKAAHWLGGKSDRENAVVEIRADQISWKLGMEHIFTTEQGKNIGESKADLLIYKATKGDKCVVFSNSREETEEVCASLRSIAKKRGEEDRFAIHHGNLSASIREAAEDALKNEEKAITACATVTLELGIDIGKLRRIINQGSPTSVSGFLQRLGRSGRRDMPPEMLMVFREEEPLPGTPLPQLIPWELLQAIAIVELYRTERWIEPSGEKKLPASLLFHQTLSVLASAGSLPAHKLASRVLSLSPFAAFTKEQYKDLLTHMLRQDFLELTEDKELIVGSKGEKLLSSFKFYAVFKDSEDFTVRCGSEEIGTISSTPPIGERFALAGKVWEVEEVDVSRRLIYTKPVEGKMKISWPGESGFIHTKILEKMKEILSSKDSYSYLMPSAAERLEKARNLAQKTGLCHQMLLSLGGNSFALFPWLGTKSFQALKRALQKKIAPSLSLMDVQSAGCYFLTFRTEKSDEKMILDALKNWSKETSKSKEDLITETEYPVFDKYDSYLPHPLMIASFAENRLDPTEAKKRMEQIK